MNRKDIDSSVFENYTEESCYWAGLLAADGCIGVNGTIGLELNDKDAVEEFKKFCSAEHIVSSTIKNSYRIRFVSEKIQQDLLYNFNVSTDKTFNLTVPLLPSSKLYANYYRGFFDGDGCLTEFFNNRPTASFRVFLTSGSLEFLQETLLLLKNLNIIKGGSIQNKAASCWHIQLAINDSISFLNWIYDSKGYSLERKYEKYYNLIVLGNRAHI